MELPSKPAKRDIWDIVNDLHQQAEGTIGPLHELVHELAEKLAKKGI